jgi:uncharacterized protein YdiU (UPF0061 family)
MTQARALDFDNHYARLGEPFAVGVAPTPLVAPRLAHFNADAAALAGLDAAAADDPALLMWASGGAPPPGAEPVAMLYAGHQFGHFVPQLGDGRAILLGQARAPAGGTWDLHLKGSGPTPFSRGFDGRAVLRSTIREYLCGEAMHHLGVPTTRALCLVASEEPVLRETQETGAALVRMAPTHVRFGSFEVFAARGQTEHLRTLADYVIGRWLPEIDPADDDRHGRMLEEVARRTARLIAAWQAVGFTHGVMNTDNMSILGLTLDYGPFGFVDRFEAGYVPNHSDHDGRYALDQQPAVGLWNLDRLAWALLLLMTRERAAAALEAYVPAFEARWAELMRAKLGLAAPAADDAALVSETLTLLHRARVDYTLFWRALAGFRRDGTAAGPLRSLFTDPAPFDVWAERYGARLRLEEGDDAARAGRMRRANPKYVLRTWLAQQAIDRAVRHGDFGEMDRLLTVLRAPFDEHPEMETYAAPPPDWARGLVLSCSS